MLMNTLCLWHSGTNQSRKKGAGTRNLRRNSLPSRVLISRIEGSLIILPQDVPHHSSLLRWYFRRRDISSSSPDNSRNCSRSQVCWLRWNQWNNQARNCRRCLRMYTIGFASTKWTVTSSWIYTTVCFTGVQESVLSLLRLTLLLYRQRLEQTNNQQEETCFSYYKLIYKERINNKL